MSDRKLIISEWLIRAQEDENNVAALIKDKDVTPSLVCFLSHQMAKKYLKALLLFYSGDYPKIHDLTILGNLMNKHNKDISELKEYFITLNPYYIGTRYASDFPEGFTWKMAEEAYFAAQTIKNFVLQKIAP